MMNWQWHVKLVYYSRVEVVIEWSIHAVVVQIGNVVTETSVH